jgi:DNA-binding XRE family transcriptional regulator
VSRKSKDKRWNSKFGVFLLAYGVKKLARELSLDPSAIYHWMRGRTSPHHATAIEIRRIAGSQRVSLSIEEIYQQKYGKSS